MHHLSSSEASLDTSNLKIISILIALIILSSTIIVYINIRSLYGDSIYKTENTDKLLSKAAEIAWRYYQPGVGVNPNTGLHYAKLSWHGFTDWDLAGYILTVLDAGDIGLISIDGVWGVKYRLNKVLNFLANRELSPDGIPYWGYNADTMKPTNTNRLTNPSDAGRLLIALYKVKKKFPEYSKIVNYIVYNKTRYDKIASNPNLNWGSGFYLYYIAQGFKLFGFDKYDPVKKGLNEINRLMNGEFVKIYGIDIPVTYVTSEPVVHGILDLNLGGDFRTLADRIYKVQELRYVDKGVYTAFSEGVNDRYPYYVYEWIVQGSADKLWTVTYSTSSGLKNANISPIIFTKIGISFLAIYNTSYAKGLAKYLISKTASSYGFYEGVDENGRVVYAISDKTNSMVINAARYAGIHISKGYTLTVKVLDWDGSDPIRDAKVYVNNMGANTNENGTIVFNNLRGNVTIRVYYLGVLVSPNISIFLSGDRELTINADIYDLNLYVLGGTGEDIVNATLNIMLNNNTIYSVNTDENGYARVEDIPVGEYNVTIYSGLQHILLKRIVLTLNMDEEVARIYLNPYANIKINSNISIYM